MRGLRLIKKKKGGKHLEAPGVLARGRGLQVRVLLLRPSKFDKLRALRAAEQWWRRGGGRAVCQMGATREGYLAPRSKVEGSVDFDGNVPIYICKFIYIYIHIYINIYI